MKLARTADKVASEMRGCNWDDVRDACDTRTGGDLPPSLLDRLTDMAVRRIIKRKRAALAKPN